MPVTITAHGGLQPLANVQYLKQNEADAALRNIHAHLSVPGRGTGTLVIKGRGDDSQAMRLERKNWFQLMFTGKSRVHDTRDAIRELLRNAGRHDALAGLDQYLANNGGQPHRRIPASELLRLLNPVYGSAPGSAIEEQAAVAGTASVVPPHPANALAPPAASAPVPIDPQSLGSMAGNLSAALAPRKVRGQPERPLAALLSQSPIDGSAQDLANWLGLSHSGARGESGSYGEAIPVTIPGDPTTRILKAFKARVPEGGRDQIQPKRLTPSRDEITNEANVRYLQSKKDDQWNLAQPIVRARYTVVAFQRPGKTPEVKIASELELRKLLDDAAMKAGDGSLELDNDNQPRMKYDIIAIGQLMPMASGEELGARLSRPAPLRGDIHKAFVRSGIEGLKTLARKGIVHRDIKPSNMFFDGTKTSFIDPSMVFKQSRNRPELQFCAGWGGSPGYMHPRAVDSREHSFETDLYALGMSALEAAHPGAMNIVLTQLAAEDRDVSAPLVDRSKHDGRFIRDLVQRLIDQVPARSFARDALVILQRDLSTPGTEAHFATIMLDKAAAPSDAWVNRYQAQRFYDDLLRDAYLSAPST